MLCQSMKELKPGSLQLPSGYVVLDMARDGVINSKGDEMKPKSLTKQEVGYHVFSVVLEELRSRDLVDEDLMGETFGAKSWDEVSEKIVQELERQII